MRMDVTARIGMAEIAPDVWSRTSLRPHRADQFTVQLPQLIDAPAEAWARAIFGDVPDIGQRFIFQALLRYPLARGPSPSTIAGWPIMDQGDTWVRLENWSSSTICHLIVSPTARAFRSRRSCTTANVTELGSGDRSRVFTDV